MKGVSNYLKDTKALISRISDQESMRELEQASTRYHITAAWIAIIFDPIFAITDYFNIPNDWGTLLAMRLSVSVIVISALLLRKRLNLSSYTIVFIPFILISIQNAYVYSVLDSEDLVGQNLNYMALLLGGSLFILWHWVYSIVIVFVVVGATAFFLSISPTITINDFFVNGGLLMIVVAAFMVILIKTRYDLTLKEIKARLALRESNEELVAQAEEIKSMNDNLERMVLDRTIELERKNKALEEYAFINAHKLRAPVASILGLMDLLLKLDMNDEAKNIAEHLKGSTQKLDDIVRSIRESIERAD